MEPQPNISDEELAAFQAQQAALPPSESALAAEGAAAPPSGVPVVPPPEYGPPAPSPTDAIAAGLPPAPGGIPTRDPMQELAPGVPREAPGNVGAPGQAAPVAGGPAPSEMDEAAKRASEARGEKTEAEIKAEEGKAPELAAKADAAEQTRANAEEAVNREAEIRKHYDTADQTAQTQLAQTRQALSQFKFKDYWADKSTGQKVLSSLGVMFGAFGAGLTHTANYALQILDKDMDTNRQQQLDHLKQLSDDEVRAATGVDDARLGRQRALADITTADANLDRMIAKQMDASIASNQYANNNNILAAKSAALKESAAQKDVEALNLSRKAALQQQLDQAKINEENARAEKERQWAEVTRETHKKKGGGTGAGGGGDKMLEAQQELAHRLRTGKDGKPLSFDDEIAALRDVNKQFGVNIPTDAKAGHPSLTNVKKGAAFDADQARKDAKGGLMGDRLLEQKVKNFASEHQLPKLESNYRKLQEVQEMLASGNPTAAMTGLMEYDQGAKGAAATEASMNALKGHLGGSWDTFKGWIQNKETGNFGAAQLKNLSDAVNVGIKSFKHSVEPIHQAFYEKLDGSKPEVKNAAAGLFRTFGYQEKGGAGASEGGSMAAGARKKQGGHVYEFKGGDAKDPSNWQAVAQ